MATERSMNDICEVVGLRYSCELGSTVYAAHVRCIYCCAIPIRSNLIVMQMQSLCCCTRS